MPNQNTSPTKHPSRQTDDSFTLDEIELLEDLLGEHLRGDNRGKGTAKTTVAYQLQQKLRQLRYGTA